MANLGVKNITKSYKSGKKANFSEQVENTDYTNKKKAERLISRPLNTNSKAGNQRMVTIYSFLPVSGAPGSDQARPVLKLYQPKYEPEEYILHLRKEVEDLRQLTASLGIQRELKIARNANKLHLRTSEKLDKNKQSSLWWRMSKRWTKHRGESDSVKRETKGHNSNVHNIDLSQLQIPKGMRRRLDPVCIPNLGITYRLPRLRKQHSKHEANLLNGSYKRHKAICDIIVNRILSDVQEGPKLDKS